MTGAQHPPTTSGPLRVAVGAPDGDTSNSWRMWIQRSGIYVTCRENVRFYKTSLHASGRWRVGATDEAIAAGHVPPGEAGNRAWEVWDAPAPKDGKVVRAYRLLFPVSELNMPLEERQPQHWRGVQYVVPPSDASMIEIEIFVSSSDAVVDIEGVQQHLLASWPLHDGRRCDVIAHPSDFGSIAGLVKKARSELPDSQRTVEHHVYLYSHFDDGSRFVVSFAAKPG